MEIKSLTLAKNSRGVNNPIKTKIDVIRYNLSSKGRKDFFKHKKEESRLRKNFESKPSDFRAFLQKNWSNSNHEIRQLKYLRLRNPK